MGKRSIILFFLFLSVTFLPAQDYSIEDIQVYGLETLAEEEFWDLIDLSPDRLPLTMSRSEILDRESALRQSGYFRTFRIEHEEDTLIFHLEENPFLGDIEITGNNIISTRRLRTAIRRSLREADADKYYSFQTDSLIRQAVIGRYHRRHFYNVTVDIKDTVDNNTVHLEVAINEEDHFEIDEVNIRGNDHFSNWRIRRQIQSRVSRIFRRRYYYPEMVHRDITQIIRFYHDHGFLDVEVDKEVETDEEQRTAAISFHIREGDQYYWDDLKIYGNTLFTDSEVQNQLQQLQQETFSYSLWYRQDASRIFNLYANEGFLDTEVETDFIRNDNKVDLVVHIDEGIRHEVSDIQIIRPPLDLDDLGFWEKLSLIISPPVEEDIIRKYFRVQEGDIYKKHQVERGYYNLMNSNLFERVQLRGEPTPFQQETVPYFAQTLPGALGEEVPEEPDKRDIQIELDEKATGHLMLSAGYGEDIGVFGQIRLREENFRGRGHTLSLAGTFASKYHSVHGSYYIPFFRGRTDQSLLTEMYSSLYQRPEYDETRRGIEFEVGNEISDYLRWYWGAKLAQVSMDLDSGVERGIDISTNTYDHIQDYERYYLAGPTIGIREDTRDSHTFPTSGYRQQYELNLLGAFGGEFLPNISGDFRWFYPITEDYIWANNLAMDWTMRDVDSIPLPERNYLGGSRTVRGYAFRGIIPKDPLEDDLALGGSGRFLVKTEVRRRFTENFSLAAFLDGGVLGHSHLMDWDDPWKFGTGLQFAFHLPIGDISIDVAHALNPDRRDDRQTIHFNLGFNF